jgi:general secretion pathway protein L
VKDFTTENTMANAIQQHVDKAWGRIKSGPVAGFFRWWVQELRQAMPNSWQERLEHALRRAVFVTADGQLRVGSDENRRIRFLDDFPLTQDATLQRQQVEELLEEADLSESARYLLLDSSRVLRKAVRLPLAAEPNLMQVLGFEMDRQTPFSAADVYFDYQMVSRDADAAQLEVELFVVPRAEADHAVQAITGRGLSLAGVDVRDGDETMGLNLLPPEKRVRPANSRGRMNLAMAAAAVLLLSLVMWQSLALREHQVAELEAAIADVQGEARAVMKIRDQIEDTSEAAGFLATRRAEKPLSIALISDLTEILPDDTYLDRLAIGKSSVQLQGKSSNAQQLIELVNQSSLMRDASFRGSTRLDTRSGLEIFEVNAVLTGTAGE